MRNELIEKIDKLEKQIFYLECKDRWNSDDYYTSSEWHKELRLLKKQLAELPAED